ncbi:hypothetical protein SGLAM104S_01996 [Streptomyces glaucescens]
MTIPAKVGLVSPLYETTDDEAIDPLCADRAQPLSPAAPDAGICVSVQVSGVCQKGVCWTFHSATRWSDLVESRRGPLKSAVPALLRLNAEARDEATMAKIRDEVLTMIRA